MNGQHIIYFGSGSYRHLSNKNYEIYSKVRKAILKLTNKSGNCRMDEIYNELKGKISINSIKQYTFILCASTENLKQRPLFIMRTKLAKTHPKYKMVVQIHRVGGLPHIYT